MNGVAVDVGADADVVAGAPETADVGLAAADAAALEALVATDVAGAEAIEVDGLVVAAEPPHAVTKRAVVTSRAALRRPNVLTGSNTSSFPVLSTELLDSVGRLDAVDALCQMPIDTNEWAGLPIGRAAHLSAHRVSTSSVDPGGVTSRKLTVGSTRQWSARRSRPPMAWGTRRLDAALSVLDSPIRPPHHLCGACDSDAIGGSVRNALRGRCRNRDGELSPVRRYDTDRSKRCRPVNRRTLAHHAEALPAKCRTGLHGFETFCHLPDQCCASQVNRTDRRGLPTPRLSGRAFVKDGTSSQLDRKRDVASAPRPFSWCHADRAALKPL